MARAPDLPEAFRIGVKPLGAADWFVVDDDLGRYLGEKARLGSERFDEVFAAEQDTQAAQSEALALIVDALVETHPGIYRGDGNAITIASTGETVQLDDEGTPPLWTAARLVAEDLVLMRRNEAGWRIAAAALCFPSSWRLEEKFGRSLDAVHAEVPDFGAGTRNATIIARMFDNLRPETPMLRWNWGLYGDDALFHPYGNAEGGLRFGADGEAVFLRLERQTLTRLPETGDIVFTIRIYVDPLAAIATMEGGRELAQSLVAQLKSFSPEQLAYKGLGRDHERLMARLQQMMDE